MRSYIVSVFPEIVKDCPKIRNLPKIFLRSFENVARPPIFASSPTTIAGQLSQLPWSFPPKGWRQAASCNKKAVLPQGNREMPHVFFSVKVRQQHSLQV